MVRSLCAFLLVRDTAYRYIDRVDFLSLMMKGISQFIIAIRMAVIERAFLYSLASKIIFD